MTGRIEPGRGLRPERTLLTAVLLFCLALGACAAHHQTSSAAEPEPASIERVPGSQYPRIHLSALAAKRLGIQTATVQGMPVPSGSGPSFVTPPAAGPASPPRATTPPSAIQPRRLIPYAAVLYQPNGDAFAYINPSPLVFVRQPLNIDYIVGDWAVLEAGPPQGTVVVTVGGDELLGIELGVAPE
jgi:hypothetical protein